jgi:hypothetical protein
MRIRTLEELTPDIAGYVFVTASPNFDWQALGWMATNGDVYIGRTMYPPEHLTLDEAVEQMQEQSPHLEVITGAEADALLAAIEKLDLH